MDEGNVAESQEDQASNLSHRFSAKKEKKEKPGVIYLSSVPEYMSVQKLRNIFSEYGEVGRTFFQPVGKASVKYLTRVIDGKNSAWCRNYRFSISFILS